MLAHRPRRHTQGCPRDGDFLELVPPNFVLARWSRQTKRPTDPEDTRKKRDAQTRDGRETASRSTTAQDLGTARLRRLLSVFRPIVGLSRRKAPAAFWRQPIVGLSRRAWTKHVVCFAVPGSNSAKRSWLSQSRSTGPAASGVLKIRMTPSTPRAGGFLFTSTRCWCRSFLSPFNP